MHMCIVVTGRVVFFSVCDALSSKIDEDEQFKMQVPLSQGVGFSPSGALAAVSG